MWITRQFVLANGGVHDRQHRTCQLLALWQTFRLVGMGGASAPDTTTTAFPDVA
jgi:hypothetical protein